MPGLYGPITAHQRSVLQWIADGCPPDVMTGHSYKTVAVALQSRHLADVTRKGGGWQAQVTDAGHYYLEHGTYLPGHRRWAKVPPSRAEEAAAARTDTTPTGAGPIGDPVEPVPDQDGADGARGTAGAASDEDQAQLPRQHPSAALIDEVITAGGVLPIDAGRDRDEVDRYVSWAGTASNLPPGQRLRRRWRGWPDAVFEVYLEDDFWALTPERPVPVPQRVPRYHPVVAAYRDDPDRHDVSGQHLARACRVLQALVAEAEQRGHQVAYLRTAPDRHSTERRDLLRAGQVRVTIAGTRYDLRIREESAPGTEPIYTLRSRRPLPAWQGARRTIFVPTGRLKLSLDQGVAHDGRTGEFRNSKTRPLEDRLPVVLREVEARALEHHYRERERERAEEEERRRQEEAEAAATVQFHEAHRAGVLRWQVQQWRAALDLDRYLGDLGAVVAGISDAPVRQEAQAWLDWARRHRDRTDPLRQPITMPPLPDPTAADLAPYLPGRGARGLHSRRRVRRD